MGAYGSKQIRREDDRLDTSSSKLVATSADVQHAQVEPCLAVRGLATRDAPTGHANCEEKF